MCRRQEAWGQVQADRGRHGLRKHRRVRSELVVTARSGNLTTRVHVSFLGQDHRMLMSTCHSFHTIRQRDFQWAGGFRRRRTAQLSIIVVSAEKQPSVFGDERSVIVPA